MKALLLSEVFPPQHGGSGRWLWEVYRRLPRERVVILAGEHPDAAAFDRGHGVSIHRAPFTFPHWGLRSLANIREYRRLKRRAETLVEEFECDRIHCARLLPEGWLASTLHAATGLPYVCYVHGEELRYGVASRELRWMMKRVLSRASLLIANSQNSRRLLTHEWGQPASRVVVLHPGVDASQFVPAARDECARQALGWCGRTVVLTAGRLQKRKGHDMMIRALPRIRARVANVLYAIAGDGDERDTLRGLTAELGLAGHVQFLGEPSDAGLVTCYQQCDLFALPNRNVNGDIEGFGIVLVEAQACAKAVIAGDSGGTRETMRVGQTGAIVDCTRPEPLADLVTSLLLDETTRAEMGAAGRQWVQESLDWAPLAAQARGVLLSEASSDRVTTDSPQMAS